MLIFLTCVRARLLFYSDQKTADRLVMTDLQLHNYPVQQLELPGVRDLSGTSRSSRSTRFAYVCTFWNRSAVVTSCNVFKKNGLLIFFPRLSATNCKCHPSIAVKNVSGNQIQLAALPALPPSLPRGQKPLPSGPTRA